MSTFKPKRISGEELAARIAPVTSGLPAMAPQPAPMPVAKAPPTVQVNFKASVAFADLIAREAVKAGSTRRLFARLMRDAGFDVPEADVSPMVPRRRGAE